MNNKSIIPPCRLLPRSSRHNRPPLSSTTKTPYRWAESCRRCWRCSRVILMPCMKSMNWKSWSPPLKACWPPTAPTRRAVDRSVSHTLTHMYRAPFPSSLSSWCWLRRVTFWMTLWSVCEDKETEMVVASNLCSFFSYQAAQAKQRGCPPWACCGGYDELYAMCIMKNFIVHVTWWILLFGVTGCSEKYI